MANSGLEQALRIHFEHVTGQVTTAMLQEATRQAAKAGLDAIRKRNSKGIGTDGGKFAARKPAYLKRKQKLLSRYTGGYAANSTSDWMRFSGNLYRNMAVKNIRIKRTGKGLAADFTLYIKGSKTQKQVEGLLKKRAMWPLSDVGTAQRAREERAMLKRFRSVLRNRLLKGVVIEL